MQHTYTPTENLPLQFSLLQCLSLPRQTPVQTTATSLETLIRFPGPLFLSPSIHISLWLSFSACFQFSGIRFDSIQLSSAPSKDVCWQDQFVLFSVASVIKPIPLLDCLSLFLSLFPSPGSHSLHHCNVCPSTCMHGNLITECYKMLCHKVHNALGLLAPHNDNNH